MNKNGRIRYLDIARGIAIICIILGHLNNAHINQVVFTFHVPVFYFITGYFLGKKSSVKAFIRQKARSLLVPYWITCLFVILFSCIKSLAAGDVQEVIKVAGRWIFASVYGAGDSYTTPFVIPQIGAIWFLLASFWGSVFLRLTLEMKTNKRIVTILLLFVVGIWSRNLFWFPFSIQAGCCAAFFMYFGYIIRQLKDLPERIPFEAKAVWTVFAAVIWVDFIRNFQSFWLVHCDIGRGAIDVFGSVCACYCLVLISLYIDQHFDMLSSWFACLGRYSIMVLCVHLIELDTFPWDRIIGFLTRMGFPAGYELIYLIVCKLTLDITVSLLLVRVKFIRKLFVLK